MLKNGIRGVYHSVGRDYLQTYVNEYAFRYNHRDDDAPMFRTIAERVREVRSGRLGAYAPAGRQPTTRPVPGRIHPLLVAAGCN